MHVVLPQLYGLLEPRESVSRAVPTLPVFQLNLIKISMELPGFDTSLISTRKLFSSEFFWLPVMYLDSRKEPGNAFSFPLVS